jgi:hypothetical protein
MNKNTNNPNGNDIRFITSDYKELFRVPDGGYITINNCFGEIMIRKCVYHHDECHVEIGNRVYHIREFAGHLERISSTAEPCPEPEVVHGYLITDRMPVNDKVFVVAHNPDAVQEWVTWQGRNDRPGYDWGHYWSSHVDAMCDCYKRVEAERTGTEYDHTKRYKMPKSRDDAR